MGQSKDSGWPYVAFCAVILGEEAATTPCPKQATRNATRGKKNTTRRNEQCHTSHEPMPRVAKDVATRRIRPSVRQKKHDSPHFAEWRFVL